MYNLWRTAYALKGLTETIGLECGEHAENLAELNRRAGLHESAALLAEQIFALVDPFNDEISAGLMTALETLAKAAQRTPEAMGAHLLREYLETIVRQHALSDLIATAERRIQEVQKLQEEAERQAAQP